MNHINEEINSIAHLFNEDDSSENEISQTANNRQNDSNNNLIEAPNPAINHELTLINQSPTTEKATLTKI